MPFLKFIDKNGADNFLKGKIRLGQVKSYRNIENNTIAGKEDPEEGNFFTKKYTSPAGNAINFRLGSDIDAAYALCLYHEDDKVDINGLKRMAKFGDYVVIVNDEQEFIRRLDIGAAKKNYSFVRRDVFYYNESIEAEIEVMKLLSLGKEYFSFLKREEYFSFQKEYRYLILDNDTSNDNKWIVIENLTDIAEIKTASDLLQNIYSEKRNIV